MERLVFYCLPFKPSNIGCGASWCRTACDGMAGMEID
jgi:hypothetical protein